jgi:hypothetical protein
MRDHHLQNKGEDSLISDSLDSSCEVNHPRDECPRIYRPKGQRQGRLKGKRMEASDPGVVLGPHLRQQVPQSCEHCRDLFSFLGK